MSDTTHATHETERRIPLKRWIVLILIVAGGFAAFGPITILQPTSPVVVLPGEPIWPDSPITNTLLATLITDVILLLVAGGAAMYVRSGKLVPDGFYNFTEFLVEFLWNAAESTAGKWARKIFPFTATIFLIVFVANMVKLVPGFESIGYMKERHEGTGYAAVQVGPFWVLDKGQEVNVEEHAEGEAATHGAAGEAETQGPPCKACEVVPFLRGSATDMNFTFALAIVAVIMTQVFGLWALGPSYLTKFFNTKTMFTVPMFGVINFGVGLLELVSEIAKILSFGFRLFGNIFAGALLLSILGALTAVVVPTGLYLLETFVGVIQAYVFSMLALVFMSQATISHDGGEHH
ncbi:MAG TPA: FoF1 ATP synthase subunit a [Anaerolineales bacterium]|nr:FoF1 ATP synthase subunit a [Anaerolineales bacterium]